MAAFNFAFYILLFSRLFCYAFSFSVFYFLFSFLRCFAFYIAFVLHLYLFLFIAHLIYTASYLSDFHLYRIDIFNFHIPILFITNLLSFL